jgi:glycosyltransferase involved in cell wall biosynthesis
MSPLILLYVLAAVVLIQTFYFIVFARFAFKKAPRKKTASPPISVVVCGRNEASNWEALIAELMKQDYHEFEVVAVNDQSIDGSKDILEALELQYSKLKVVNVAENDRFFNGKKFGLTLGIKAAKYEHLLFTDADCRPLTDQWIKTMAGGFSSKRRLVLGFGAYNRSWNPLNLLIRFETIQTAIQYFSWAISGMPYMGVGRNLGYTRDLFYEQKGFVRHMHLSYGDDDLFVNNAATLDNTAIVFDKAGHTTSLPYTDFKGWFFQKRRHLAAGKNYKNIHNVILGFFGLTSFLFYIAAVLGLILAPEHLTEILVLIGIRLLAQYLVMGFSIHKLGGWEIMLFLPILEFSWIICTALQQLSNLFNGTPKRWKYRPFQGNSDALDSV